MSNYFVLLSRVSPNSNVNKLKSSKRERKQKKNEARKLYLQRRVNEKGDNATSTSWLNCHCSMLNAQLYLYLNQMFIIWNGLDLFIWNENIVCTNWNVACYQCSSVRRPVPFIKCAAFCRLHPMNISDATAPRFIVYYVYVVLSVNKDKSTMK